MSGLFNPSDEGSLICDIGRWHRQIDPNRFFTRIRKRISRTIRNVYSNIIRSAHYINRSLITTPTELGGCGIPNKSGKLQIDGPFWFLIELSLHIPEAMYTLNTSLAYLIVTIDQVTRSEPLSFDFCFRL